MKLSTFAAIAAVIGGSFLIPAPAKANHHHHRRHELRRIRREFRHDVRDFNHYRRAYNRNWRHARRIYNRGLYGYPPVIVPFGYNYYPQVQPGFGIQIRL